MFPNDASIMATKQRTSARKVSSLRLISFSLFLKINIVPIIPKGVEVVLIGDGEFRNVELISWLYTQRWHYRLRVARDTYIRDEYGEWVQLQDILLSEGETIFLQKILKS